MNVEPVWEVICDNCKGPMHKFGGKWVHRNAVPRCNIPSPVEVDRKKVVAVASVSEFVASYPGGMQEPDKKEVESGFDDPTLGVHPIVPTVFALNGARLEPNPAYFHPCADMNEFLDGYGAMLDVSAPKRQLTMDEFNAATGYDRSLHTNPDSRAWAEYFIRVVRHLDANPPETANEKPWFDLGYMHGWFANAMMAMSDYLHSRDVNFQEDRPAFGLGITRLVFGMATFVIGFVAALVFKQIWK